MERRRFLQATAALATFSTTVQGAAAVPETAAAPVLANDYVEVYRSPDPKTVYAYSPGLARLDSGRLVASMDQGGKALKEIPGIKTGADGKIWRGKIYTSDDRGRTWMHRGDMPMLHARPFVAGKSVYVLGHAGDLGIIRSDDCGETWSEPSWLTQGEQWHQAPCNVHYAHGKVYLVMEKNTDASVREWPVSVFAPVVMAGDVNANLLQRDSWTFSNALSFSAAVEQAGQPNLIGVPFFTQGNTARKDSDEWRPMAAPGWLETNIIQFTDPLHVWYDATGHTYHLWMRAHTGSTNLAAIAKAVEDESGEITVSLEKAPSGAPMVYVPCPGGQMKFHILFDDVTQLFWLLSSQATDSMTRPELLPANRFNLPNNERHRLVLHFSRNCVDWCFAGRVADTGEYGQGRHYASMVIDGSDLHVLSRSGDGDAKSAHDGNLITFHTIPEFRRLVY